LTANRGTNRGKLRAIPGGPQGSERRQAYRVRTEYVARVAVTGSDDLLDESEVFDLSSGGAKLLTGLEMDIGQRVSVSFGAPETAVNLAGTVRHIDPKPEKGRAAYGVAWDPLPEQESRQLQEILLECLARDAAADADALVKAVESGVQAGVAVEGSLAYQVASARALVSQLQGTLLLVHKDPALLYAAQEVAMGIRAIIEAMAALLHASGGSGPGPAKEKRRRA